MKQNRYLLCVFLRILLAWRHCVRTPLDANYAHFKSKVSSPYLIENIFCYVCFAVKWFRKYNFIRVYTVIQWWKSLFAVVFYFIVYISPAIVICNQCLEILKFLEKRRGNEI